MKLLAVLAAFSLLLLAGPTFAEQCNKDFPYHFITSAGVLGLYHGVGGGWWYPCSLSTTINGVTPEACKAALASYLSAKAQGVPITLSYGGTCAELNSDQSNNEGFYWFGVYW